MVGSWKKLKTSNLFSSFIVGSNRNRSALVHELLCNNSLFVGQLYEDKSLALCARDLIFFTTDLPSSSELLHNNSLLELIYFLNIIFGNSVIKRRQLRCCEGLRAVEDAIKPPVAC